MTQDELMQIIQDATNKASENADHIIADKLASLDPNNISWVDMYPLILNACKMFTVEIVSEVLTQTLPLND